MIALEADRLDYLETVEHPEHDPLEEWQIANDIWLANDASFSDYCVMASRTGLQGVASMVRQGLANFPVNTGLDIAGGTNGLAVQELIADGTLDAGVVTNLLDKRSAATTKEADDLVHVEGDILEPETWHKIFAAVLEASDGAGPSLVMHRPCAALQYLSPHFYEASFDLLFDWLRPGGVMFAQVPLIFSTSENNLQKFCGYVGARDDIETLRTSDFVNYNYSAVLTKAC